MDVLEGFERTDIRVVGKHNASSSCYSRALLEAFVKSDEECISKPMEPDELRRHVYNLRHYRRKHADEFANVGISGRNGSLILYRNEP